MHSNVSITNNFSRFALRHILYTRMRKDNIVNTNCLPGHGYKKVKVLKN